MSLLSLRDSCRLYERKARKQQKAPPSIREFNAEHNASLPTSASAEKAHKRYLKQLARAKKQHGVPLNAHVPSLYKALASADDAQLRPKQFDNVATSIATRTPAPEVKAPKIGRVPRVEQSVSRYEEARAEFKAPAAPAKPQVEQEIERAAGLSDAAMAAVDDMDPVDAYKEQLSAWMAANPASKLHKTSQVVHFVDDRATEFSPENTSAKMTQKQVALLKAGGGEFKMRSGAKKMYMELLDEDIQEIMSHMKRNIKGPYFVRVI